jgi:hypothetical protein
LEFALGALKQPTWFVGLVRGFNEPAFIVVALHATNPMRPSDFHQMGQGVFLSGEILG